MITKILITGANSYIGVSFENYVKAFPEYQIDTLDMINPKWADKDFSIYDSIFHVAGIAHSDNGKISKEKAELYYKINTELTEKVAKKAKIDGAKQFIYMSSMIVYGASSKIGREKIIDKDTVPNPQNAYGDSKLKAEKRILPMQSESFHVVVLRPPMIYGKGSKGNYPTLSKFAKKLPFFPNITNKRSMLYIENLCEFVRLMVENKEKGIFMPQNKEYTNTSQMVEEIAKNSGKNIRLTRIFNPFLRLFSPVVGVVDKVFGSLAYDEKLSEYVVDYQKISLKESIKRTEN